MGGKGKNTGGTKNAGNAPLVNNGVNMATGQQSQQLQQGEQQFSCQTINQQQGQYDQMNLQQSHQFQNYHPQNQFNIPTPPPYNSNNNMSIGQNVAHQGYQNINTTNQTGLAPSGTHSNNSQFDNGMLNIMQQIQQTNATVLSRLSSIECSVSKLTTIENDLSLLRLDVSNLKRENGSMAIQISEVESSCQTISSVFDEYIESNTKNENDITQLKKENDKLKNELQKSDENYSKLYDNVQELTARSMQENLLFFGIGESPENGQKEEIEVKIRDFLKTKVFPETPEVVDNIQFDRIHRLGGIRDRQNLKQYPRPIVAKFEKYSDRENVRKAGIDLNKKRCGYSIREQFPVEMENRRKQLYPIMRQYQENPANRVVLVRDKLYINGKLYEPSYKSDKNAPYISFSDRGRNTNNQTQQPFQAS